MCLLRFAKGHQNEFALRRLRVVVSVNMLM